MSAGAAPRAAAPLIDQLARLIESTYDIDSGTVPLGRFVVGDLGHARLTADCRCQAIGHDGRGAAVLLRPLEDGERWAAAVYLPDALVLHLERHDPRRTLSDANADAFAALVEEVDHLVTIAERSGSGAATTLLELEWHAAVTKYLVLAHFAGRLSGRPLDAAARAFVEGHVFHRAEFDGPGPRDPRPLPRGAPPGLSLRARPRRAGRRRGAWRDSGASTAPRRGEARALRG